MPSIKKLGLIVAFGLMLAGCRTAPIYNVQQTDLGISPSRNVTLEQVAQAIKTGGGKGGWTFRDVEPGRMTGQLNLRTHVAIVDIRYDTRTFSIAYRDSSNLHYSGGQIHQNYNGWVQNLERAIRTQAQTL